jgi:hypothetical protein
MTPRILEQIGLCFLVAAIGVLLFSIYRSSFSTPSMGLSSLGSVLLVLGIVMRVRARRASAKP